MNDPRLDQAYAARQSGNVEGAVALCRQMLAADPAHRGARSLIGVCLAEAGRVGEARSLIEEAASAEPGNWRFLLNLSVLRQIEGDAQAAIECASQATALAPDRFEAWARLGDLCGKQGDFEGAVNALDKALALNPGHPGLALLLAGAAYETGQYDRSAQALETFERVARGHPEALRLRTHLARKRGDMDAFVETATTWLAADPASEPARVALAHGHAQREDYHRSAETYRPLVEANPQDADHAATFARYLLWARDYDAAERSYRRALELRPDHSEAASGLARLNIYRGRLGEAADLASRALESDPANVDAYGQLALATESRFSDEQLGRLHRLAEDPKLDVEHRVIAWFTLGDVHHKRKEHDQAFSAWQTANDLKLGLPGSGHDRRETEKLVDRLIASFNAFPPRMAARESGPTPIFIVGMPRSGTTLLDSALAAHADINSGGELPVMPAALNLFLAWADGAGWRGGPIPDQIAAQLRDRYSRQYQEYRIPTAAFVTDKQPLNILSVGLIRHLYPTAPIIHIRRDPMETGFSIYRNNFTRSWTFSTSLSNIGHYYGQYARLMSHWNGVLGDDMVNVQYEQLVRDFEGELRRLLSHFGIAWDPGCLTYHEGRNIVTTLSATQVRKAPSEKHINSTAPYARALEPLRAALEEAGVDLAR